MTDHPGPTELRDAPGRGAIGIVVEYLPAGVPRRVHTHGLSRSGLPELFADPPARAVPKPLAVRVELALALALALIVLGHELLEAEDIDLEPYTDIVQGRSVRFWLDRQEAPDEELAAVLGPAVDTVIRVGCSLWAPTGPPHGAACDLGSVDPRAPGVDPPAVRLRTAGPERPGSA